MTQEQWKKCTDCSFKWKLLLLDTNLISAVWFHLPALETPIRECTVGSTQCILGRRDVTGWLSTGNESQRFFSLTLLLVFFSLHRRLPVFIAAGVLGEQVLTRVKVKPATLRLRGRGRRSSMRRLGFSPEVWPPLPSLFVQVFINAHHTWALQVLRLRWQVNPKITEQGTLLNAAAAAAVVAFLLASTVNFFVFLQQKVICC